MSYTEKNIESIPEDVSWNVVSDGKKLSQRIYTNGKQQIDVSRECLGAINRSTEKLNKAFIFLDGPPGSGKSIIGLNMAKKVGKTIIVVPKKNLQDQYNIDYSENTDADGKIVQPKIKIIKDDGEALTISTDKGRGNFFCKYMEEFGNGVRCSDKHLPCTVALMPKQKRKSVASKCPYWSPVFHENNYVDCDNTIDYESVTGEKYIHVRKSGCGYYEQFIKNVTSDVTVINNKKFLLEAASGRITAADLLIIDEVDLFLDELKSEYSISISDLKRNLENQSDKRVGIINMLQEIEDYVEKTNPSEPMQIDGEGESIEPVTQLIDELTENRHIYIEDPYLEDLCNHLGFYNDFRNLVWANFNVEFRKSGEKIVKVTLFVLEVRHLVEWLLGMFPRIMGMSATIHSPLVLEKIYGINPDLYAQKIIKSCENMPGTLNLAARGSEFKCNKQTLDINRERYLRELSECVTKAKGQTLVHVIAYKDLPSSYAGESTSGELGYMEEIRDEIRSDFGGRRIKDFKNKNQRVLFSTTDMRGTDLPGDKCTSIIFTKAPYPNPMEPFYRALSKQNKNLFWRYYGDKMKRELLQGVARGLRQESDVVDLYSPDSRVFQAIQEIARGGR